MSSIATLSLAAFDVLWQDLRLDLRPYPLDIPHHGTTYEERATIRQAVYDDLQDRGLARGDRVDLDVVDALRLLAGHTVWLDAMALLNPRQLTLLRALAVARGTYAVLAVQERDGVRLERLRHTALISSIVGLVPPNRPGPGVAVTVSVAELAPERLPDGRRVVGEVDVFGRPAKGTTQSSQLRAVRMIMERPRLRLGQFGGGRCDAAGRRQRLPGLAWFDTDAGRYVNTLRRGRDGQDWITVAPADNARIAHRIAEMFADGHR